MVGQPRVAAARRTGPGRHILPARPQVYATSSAMLVTMAISVAFFGLEPSLQLLLGILTAAVSLVLYYVPPATLTAKPEPRADKPGSSDDLQRLPR